MFEFIGGYGTGVAVVGEDGFALGVGFYEGFSGVVAVGYELGEVDLGGGEFVGFGGLFGLSYFLV